MNVCLNKRSLSPRRCFKKRRNGAHLADKGSRFNSYALTLLIAPSQVSFKTLKLFRKKKSSARRALSAVNAAIDKLLLRDTGILEWPHIQENLLQRLQLSIPLPPS